MIGRRGGRADEPGPPLIGCRASFGSRGAAAAEMGEISHIID